jgi:excisionase family DNA binding protein
METIYRFKGGRNMLTAKQIATQFNIHPATVKVWIREGKLKAKITPRGYVINESQLKDYLAKYKK